MGLRDLNARHLTLVGRYSTRYAVRGGSALVYTLVALFFSLLAAHAVLTPVEETIRQQAEQGMELETEEVVDRLADLAREVVAWAIGGPQAEGPGPDTERQRWVSYLLDDRPAILSAVFLILVFGIPLVLPLGAFNQTAGDIGSRGIRYLLLRTERGNIYLGRFLSTVVFVAAINALGILTIALYVGLKLGIYGAWELTGWSLHGFLALTVLSIPYIALCAWFSASNDSPIVSLLFCSLVIGGVPLAAYLGKLAWEPARHVKYLLPWGFQNRLLHPDLATVGSTALLCLVYAAVFLWIGFVRIEKRDL